MQFNFTDPQSDFEQFIGGYYCVNISGTIAPGDDNRFRNFLEKSSVPPRATVYIDSIGGDVDAAIGIGRIIREQWFSTSIGQYRLSHPDPEIPVTHREFLKGHCMSAATLIYLGGRLRYFENDSTFGVHQFSFKDPSPEHLELSQLLSSKIARYVSDMGITPEFLEISSATLNNEIDLIEADKLRHLNVVTDGETDVDWSLQAVEGTLYARGERDSLFGHHKVMLAYRTEIGFFFWAVVEAQGREEELTSFGLVEIVLNGEKTRIDISDRCLREVHGIYVNIIAELTQAEAQSIVASESFGVHIRFSSEAEMFLGIAAMSTEGGKEQLEALYHNLRNND